VRTYIVKYTKKSDLSTIPIEKIKESKSVLVQIFSGIIDEKFLKGLTKEILSLLPEAKIIGTTTDGEILGDEVTINSCVIAVSTFEKTEIKIGYVENVTPTNSLEKGKELASLLNEKEAKCMISFCDGLYTNGEDFTKGVSLVNKKLILSGGLAGDNAEFIKTFVICNDKVLNKGAVGAVLINPSLKVGTNYKFGWIPIGKKLKITGSVKNRVYTIEDMKAVDAYRHYLGEECARTLPKTGIEFPLIRIEDGMEVARAVVSKHEDGSLTFAGNVLTGEYYQFGLGSADLLLNDSSDEFENESESIFIYSCMARRRFLANNTASFEISSLNKISTTVGFFTYGEFFHNEGKNKFLNETMTILTLSEGVNKEPKILLEQEKNNPVNYEYYKTLKALSHLVTVANNELEHLGSLMEFESRLFVNGPVMVFKCKANENFDVEYISANVINHFGYSSYDFTSRKISFKEIVLRKDFNRIRRRLKELQKNIKTSLYEDEFAIISKDKKLKYFSVYLMAERNREGEITHFYGYMIDISTRKEMEKKLKYLAYHDPLTALYNRAYFKEKLSSELEPVLKTGLLCAIIFFDVNKFKHINDTFGHSVGDELLEIIAKEIKSIIREEDIFFRFGGDEFVLVLTYLKKDRVKKDIEGFYKRVKRIFEKPLKISGYEIKTSISMGVSLFPKDSENLEDVLKYADKAMYASKKEKFNKLKFYEDIRKESSSSLFEEKDEDKEDYLIKDSV